MFDKFRRAWPGQMLHRAQIGYCRGRSSAGVAGPHGGGATAVGISNSLTVYRTHGGSPCNTRYQDGFAFDRTIHQRGSRSGGRHRRPQYDCGFSSGRGSR